jgi:uncharacterized membrane protein
MKKIKLFDLSPFQFFLTSMNGMVYGLFATLIISVILNQLGLLLNIQLSETVNIGTEITKVSSIVRGFLGVGIGVGIAWALKLQGLKLIGAMVIGGLSTATGASGLVLRADPLVAYVTTISALLVIEMIFKKKTPFDIILIPLLSILTGTLWAHAASKNGAVLTLIHKECTQNYKQRLSLDEIILAKEQLIYLLN